VSYTEDQLWQLLEQASAMPYGPGQIALVEQVVGHADAQSLHQLAFTARMQATTAYVYGGEPSRAVVTFAWCITEFDRDPMTYRGHQRTLLWHFKYTISALLRVPDVPLERIHAVLDDMQRRWQETGHTLHAVYAYRHHVARHVGDVAAAEQYFGLWNAEPRDDLSDCAGCDPTSKAVWLAEQGRDEQAVALAEPVLGGRLTCTEQPQSILTAIMTPYLRTGRLDEARDAHRRAYRLHRPHLADLAEIADHIEFCARTGNEARAVEMLERHLGWLDRAPSPWAAMRFAAAGALALRSALALEPGELTVYRPGHGERPAARVGAADLAQELAGQAEDVAARFDARNGTDRVGTLVRQFLAPGAWAAHLPLSPTARRTSTQDKAARTVEPTGDRPTPATVQAPPAPEPVPATAGPDELLDLIEECFDADQDERAAAGLAAFRERYDGIELSAAHQARLLDLGASRQANDEEYAQAAQSWHAAADAYAALGEEERRQAALSRAGAAAWHAGEREQGVALMTAAADWLREHGQPRARLAAAGRLAGCHLSTGDPAAALATLESVAGVVAEAPPRSAARFAVMRLITLVEGGQIDEALAQGEQVIAATETAKLPTETSRAHTALARALQDRGDLHGAADRLSAAITLLPDGLARAGLTLVRANILARTERAAEAIDPLVDAVAESVARGDHEHATHLRHSLAIAYLNSDRVLDAAEVAEEALASLTHDESPTDGADASAPLDAVLSVRSLLSAIYRRLDQPAEAAAQLRAMGELLRAAGQDTEAGRCAEEAGDILDRANRDADAAGAYLVAAEAFARAGSVFDELRNRRQHALSLHWAFGPARGLAALPAAEVLLERLDEGPAARWERARLGYDEARMRWAAGDAARRQAEQAGGEPDGGAELNTAAQLAAQAALDWDAIGEAGPASHAWLLSAQILLSAARADAAVAAARQALRLLPDPQQRPRFVGVLDAALRANGETAQADAIWAEYGLTRPSTED